MILNRALSKVLRKIFKFGAFHAQNKIEKVFCFVRVNPENSVCEEIQNLKEREINMQLPPDQIYRIRANQNDSHLKTVNSFYLTQFQKLIEKCVKENPEMKRTSLVQDTLCHFDFIRSNHLSRELTSSQVMKSLSEFVFDPNPSQRPLIITGPSGCGKSAYTATLASNLFLQFKANKSLNTKSTSNFGLVSRFIGVDGKTFYLRNLLKSLCHHFNFFYVKHSTTKNEEFARVPNKLSLLKEYFKNFLSDKNPLFNEFKLVMIIDGLDALDPRDHSFRLDWLPKSIAINARLILTVSSNDTKLVDRLRAFYLNEARFIWLSRVEEDQAKLMLRKTLNNNGYRLEKEQVETLMRFMKERPVLPLHFQLCADEFLKWKSFTKLDECVLEKTLESAIKLLFDRLEKSFNKRLVKHLLGKQFIIFKKLFHDF